MPFADYKNFADCVAKNKDKDSPDAYCGYIKNQVEGGKKKEEAMDDCPSCHEAYHLEEDVKKMEEELAPKSEEDEVKHLEEEVAKMEEEAGIKKDEAPSLAEASLQFVNTLSATINEVTLMAKDEGWPSNSGVSDKVSPSAPTKVNDVTGELTDVVVNRPAGPVQINWFNTVLSEMRDIVKSANSFFEDAGWNSKEVVKEYNAHKKKWGKDWI
jgi:cytochrome c556